MDVTAAQLGQTATVAILGLHAHHLISSILKLFRDCRDWRGLLRRVDKMDDIARHGLVFQVLIIIVTMVALPGAVAKALTG